MHPFHNQLSKNLQSLYCLQNPKRKVHPNHLTMSSWSGSKVTTQVLMDRRYNFYLLPFFDNRCYFIWTNVFLSYCRKIKQLSLSLQPSIAFFLIVVLLRTIPCQVTNNSAKGIRLLLTKMMQLYYQKRKTFPKLRMTQRHIKGPRGLVMTQRRRLIAIVTFHQNRLNSLMIFSMMMNPLTNDEIA